jgi:hypothetical protein
VKRPLEVRRQPLDAAASFTTSSVLSVPDRIRSWQVDGLKPTSS